MVGNTGYRITDLISNQTTRSQQISDHCVWQIQVHGLVGKQTGLVLAQQLPRVPLVLSRLRACTAAATANRTRLKIGATGNWGIEDMGLRGWPAARPPALLAILVRGCGVRLMRPNSGNQLQNALVGSKVSRPLAASCGAHCSTVPKTCVAKLVASAERLSWIQNVCTDCGCVAWRVLYVRVYLI